MSLEINLLVRSFLDQYPWPDVTAQHKDLGNSENISRVVVESNSSMTLTNSSLDLVPESTHVDGQNLLIKSGGIFLATDSAITARKVRVDNTGSVYGQTGGSLTTHALTSGDNGEIRLVTTTVDSDYISVNGLLDATGTTINLAGDNFSGTNGTTSLTDATLNISGLGDIDLLGTSTFTASSSPDHGG